MVSNNRSLTYMPVVQIRPNRRNPRKHSKAQIRALANSIKTFGFNAPILVDQHKQVVAGHGRLEAAKLLSLEAVHTIALDDLSEAQATAYMLADNKLTDRSSWDEPLLAAPPRAGVMASSKWFYERARGQYKNQRGAPNTASTRRFEAEFPPNQVITKTDLAKVELTFACLPNKVSYGAQKCFADFAEIVDKGWQNRALDYNDAYFKNAVAETIIFNWTDSMIGTTEWYQQDRGYKANIVTYSIAWLVDRVREKFDSEIDLDQVWRTQSVPDALAIALQEIAPKVASRIKNAPSEVRNVTEYCKRSNCWTDIKALDIRLPANLRSALVDRNEANQQRADARQVRQIDREIEFDKLVLGLVSQVGTLRSFAREHRIISPKSDAALAKLERGNVNLSSSDKSALKLLIENARSRGFELEEHA